MLIRGHECFLLPAGRLASKAATYSRLFLGTTCYSLCAILEWVPVEAIIQLVVIGCTERVPGGRKEVRLILQVEQGFLENVLCSWIIPSLFDSKKYVFTYS